MFCWASCTLNRDSPGISSSFNRDDISQSYVFSIPQTWMNDDVYFRAIVNPNVDTFESDYTNNQYDDGPYYLIEGSRRGVAWVDGYIHDDTGDHLPNHRVRADAETYLRGSFPFPDWAILDVWETESALDLSQFTSKGAEKFWSEALSHLDDWHDDCEGDDVCKAHWVMVLPDGLYYDIGINGIAELRQASGRWGGNDIVIGDWTRAPWQPGMSRSLRNTHP